MSRFLCDFYVYKAPNQLVAKFVNGILSVTEAQASANALLQQHGAKFVCVEKRGAASGAPRAPIKSPTGAQTLTSDEYAFMSTSCWVVAPQLMGQQATCPPGYSFQNGKCQPVGHQSNAEPGHGVVKCPPGTKYVNGLCVPVPTKALQKPGRRPYTPPVVAGVEGEFLGDVRWVKETREQRFEAFLGAAYAPGSSFLGAAKKVQNYRISDCQQFHDLRQSPPSPPSAAHLQPWCNKGEPFTATHEEAVAKFKALPPSPIDTHTVAGGKPNYGVWAYWRTLEVSHGGSWETLLSTKPQPPPAKPAPQRSSGAAPQLAPVTTPARSISLQPQRRVGPFESMSVLKPPTPQPNRLSTSAADLRREPGSPDQSRIRPFFNDGHVSRRQHAISGPFDELAAPGARPEQQGVRKTPSPKAPRAQPAQASSNEGRLHGGLPFALGDLSDIAQAATVAKYKGLLQAWMKSPGVSKPVPNYGTLSDDLTGPWNCMRDGRMLSGFSKWWNTSKNGSLSLGSYPASGPCKGILVAELTDMHKAGLDAWAAGAAGIVEPSNFPSYTPPPGSPGGGSPAAAPGGAPAGCLTDCEVKYGMSGGNWNPTELAKCVAACASSVVPPGGGASAQSPGTSPGGGPAFGSKDSGVVDCGPNTPCPAGQTCVGGKCQPNLPAPPSGGGEAPAKSSNTGLWVAGGVALLGTAFLVFGGGKSALLENAYSRPGERVRHLSYRDALAAFKRRYAGPSDKPAKGEAWSRYIDELAREGLITEAQASRWDNPFYR